MSAILPERSLQPRECRSRENQGITVSDKVDKLASIEWKSALLLASIGCRIDLPCVVVRKMEKEYGAQGRIAGADVISGERMLFFDDAISDGLSKLDGIKPLEQLGARV